MQQLLFPFLSLFAVTSIPLFFSDQQAEEDVFVREAIQKAIFTCRILTQRPKVAALLLPYQKDEAVKSFLQAKEINNLTEDSAYLAAGKKLLATLFPGRRYTFIAKASYKELINCLGEQLPITSSLQIKKAFYVPDLWDAKATRARGQLTTLKNGWEINTRTMLEKELNKQKNRHFIRKKWIPFSFFLKKLPHLYQFYSVTCHQLREPAISSLQKKKIWQQFLQFCHIETETGTHGARLARKFRTNAHTGEIDIYVPELEEVSYEILADLPLCLYFKKEKAAIKEFITLENVDKGIETDYLVTAFVKEKKCYYREEKGTNKVLYYLIEEGKKEPKEITSTTFKLEQKKGVLAAFYENKGVYLIEKAKRDKRNKEEEDVFFKIWLAVLSVTGLLLLFRLIGTLDLFSTYVPKRSRNSGGKEPAYKRTDKLTYQVELLMASEGQTEKGGLKNAGNTCFCNSGLQFLKVFFYGRLTPKHVASYKQAIINDYKLDKFFKYVEKKENLGTLIAEKSAIPQPLPYPELLKQEMLALPKSWQKKDANAICKHIISFYKKKLPRIKEQLEKRSEQLKIAIKKMFQLEVEKEEVIVEKLNYLKKFIAIIKELQKESKAVIKDKELGALLKYINLQGEKPLITGGQEDAGELWRSIMPVLFPSYYSLTLKEERSLEAPSDYKLSSIQTFDAVLIDLPEKKQKDKLTVENLLKTAYATEKESDNLIKDHTAVESSKKSQKLLELKSQLEKGEDLVKRKNYYAFYSYFLLDALGQVAKELDNNILQQLPTNEKEKNELQKKLEEAIITTKPLNLESENHKFQVLKTVLSPLYTVMTKKKKNDPEWKHIVTLFYELYIRKKKKKEVQKEINMLPKPFQLFFHEELNKTKKLLVKSMTLKNAVEEKSKKFRKELKELSSSLTGNVKTYYKVPERPLEEDQVGNINYLASVKKSAIPNKNESLLTLRLIRDQYDSASKKNIKNKQLVYPNLILNYGGERYKLRAAIVHSGTSGEGGHYFAYVWSKEKKIFQRISDEGVASAPNLTESFKKALKSAHEKNRKEELWPENRSVLTGITFILYKRMN